MDTAFVAHMRQRWERGMGLPSSDGLVESWKLIPQVITAALASDDRLHVLELPTGCGKTEGLSVWCATSAEAPRIGVLCATRFIAEADRIASTINEIAGQAIAVSHHSDKPTSSVDMAKADVLVVTHQALQRALSDLAISDHAGQKLDRLLQRPSGRRGLVLIDEAFDWIDTISIDLAAVRAMAAALYRIVRPDQQSSFDVLERTAQFLTDRLSDGEGLLDHAILAPLSEVGFAELVEAVGAIPDSVLEMWVGADGPAFNLKAKYTDLLQSMWRASGREHLWITKRGGRHRLFAVQNLRLGQLPPAVVFDATASVDPAYGLAGPRVSITRPAVSPRNYGNVTLHVSKGHQVGKTHLAKEAAREWCKVSQALGQQVSGGNVLVCCHKAAKAAVEAAPIPGTSFAVANWGSIDGKNVWRDCSSVVLFGLPYLDDIAPTNSLIGWGVASKQSWLASSQTAAKREVAVRSYRVGYISKSVVQAINRARCRVPVDMEGRCLRTDVYLLLPSGETGKQLLRDITVAMPGIVIQPWETLATKANHKRSDNSEKLVGYLSDAPVGIHTKATVIEALGIGASTLSRLLNPNHCNHAALVAAMASTGTTYHSRTGRGCEAYFLKQ